MSNVHMRKIYAVMSLS